VPNERLRRNRHRLLRGVLALGALFTAAFVLTRGNPNAGLFLFLAVVCVGLAVVSVFARSLPRYGGTILDRAGGSERDLLLGGLLLIALLTPWSVAIPTLRWPITFGWQSPLPLLTIAAIVLARLRRQRRGSRLAIVMAGIGLVAWFAWVGAQLLTSSFRATGFPFLPIDLLGEGWYVGLLAFAVSIDGMAADDSEEDRPARPGEVWPFAIVPGMGLTRLHYPGRGRLWLGAAVSFAFLVQANAIGAEEFQYHSSLGSLPQPHARGGVLIPLALGVLVFLASLWDTRQKLRLERTADEPSFRRPDQRGSTGV
jgi:hypothetical protein